MIDDIDEGVFVLPCAPGWRVIHADDDGKLALGSAVIAWEDPITREVWR